MSSAETHAVQLVRHLTDLYKRRRFTDLKVWSPTLLFRTLRRFAIPPIYCE